MFIPPTVMFLRYTLRLICNTALLPLFYLCVAPCALFLFLQMLFTLRSTLLFLFLHFTLRNYSLL